MDFHRLKKEYTLFVDAFLRWSLSAGVEVHVGHSRSLVHGRDAITWSTAIPERNIERDEADQLGVLSMHRSGMLASICALTKSLAVAGTHGKTSTTSMLMLTPMLVPVSWIAISVRLQSSPMISNVPALPPLIV